MDWPKVKIGDLVELISKWNPKNNPTAPSFTYIDLSSIDKERKLIHEVSIVHPSEAPSRARQLVEENDVLVSTVRPNLNGVAMVGPEYDGATASTGYCVLRSIPEKILPSFLFHWVKTPHFISEMTRNSTGANYPAVSDKTVKEHLISLPPIDEQKRIAAILNKADEIQHDSETTKEMREQVIRSLFLEMFGDPANPETQWDRKPFGGLMECKNRIRVPVKKSERETTEGTHPYYGASGIVDYVDDYLFEGEHLLISEDGANLVARVTPIAFIATGQFWVNNHAHVFVENGCLDAVYCETLFSLLDLSNHITGSAQPKLNKGNLDKIMIPVPPLEIQTKFRQIIENISKIWGRIDERNSALMDNSNSLTQELIV